MINFTLKDGSVATFDGLYTTITKGDERITLDGAVAQAIQIGFVDADGGVFFQRQLEHIKAKSYDVLYANLKARELFPVSNEAGPGVTTITYRTYDIAGAAIYSHAGRGGGYASIRMKASRCCLIHGSITSPSHNGHNVSCHKIYCGQTWSLSIVHTRN